MRKPAEFLRSQLRLRIAVFAATIAVATSLALMGIRWWPASFVALGLLFVLERQAGRGRVLDLAPLRSGILGEQAVADALAGLPSSYWVLHGVSTGHGDVDHVVIGPTGVFAIETKAWQGSFYRKRGQLHFNGKPAEHVLRQARGAAGQVRQLLLEAGIDEWVEAVVVASRASVSRSPIRFRQAYVVSIKGVVDFVTGRRRWLRSATVLAAVASLVEPGGEDRSVDRGGTPSAP
ncbi:MAG: nuclease-related domain-containing protein [Actinomycetota bacterium]